VGEFVGGKNPTVINAANTLWHYTDVVGFHGIVESNRLHLADARFLNDRTERTYGGSVVRQFVERELAGKDPKLPIDILGAIVRELRRPQEANLFICSFSERNNAMSQWERYAAHGFGYCLGFDRHRLEKCLDATDVELHQLIYGRRDQREAISRRVMQLAREFQLSGKTNSKPPSVASLQVYSTAIAIELEELALQLKTPDFRDEKEWRLIREVSDGKNVDITPPKFAPRGNLVKPYVELTFTKPGTSSCLPLVAVVCGPKLEGEVSVASARYFLARHGHYKASVEHSKLHAVWR
jgi:hypothetical protein